MTDLDRMHARLDDARQFYRSERERIERRARERDADEALATLLAAHRPWRMRAWLGVMP